MDKLHFYYTSKINKPKTEMSEAKPQLVQEGKKGTKLKGIVLPKLRKLEKNTSGSLNL